MRQTPKPSTFLMLAVKRLMGADKSGLFDLSAGLGVQAAREVDKTEAQTRLPVPKFVMTKLKNQIGGHGPDALVFRRGEDYAAGQKSSGGWFAEAVKRAKVQRVTPHDMGHSAASLAIGTGANELAVSRTLGHENSGATRARRIRSTPILMLSRSLFTTRTHLRVWANQGQRTEK
ncbi:tyrosine-type recombinase/integrase [Mycobacterium tilburgii]|uniref:tyrosine-type recombinase/integrase n=1 Tax=Mycobacterium tilburgii TaxID=44467 RepID=UPI0016425F0F|nr:tyrosine-type recombinase/integrase [Mycobacterium tilburgii]